MVLPLLWALLAGLALVLSWTTGTGAFGWVGYLMLAVWLIGICLARSAQRGLVATRELSTDRMSFGGEVTVEVTVANRGRLPIIWLTASEALPAGLPMTGLRGRVGPLSGRGQFSFRYTLHGARRGYYEVGPTLLRTGDLFGLAQRERIAAESDRVTVFPRIVAIRHARLPTRRPVGEVRARQRVLEDPTQVVGVRPYQHGDGLRSVHWRATAHTGRLQSKLFEISTQVETVVVLDLQRDHYSGTPSEAEEAAELAISAAASISHHVLDRGQRVGLLALCRDPMAGGEDGLVRVRAGRGRDQLATILSALGRIQLGPSREFSAVLEREKESLPWSSLVVVITPKMTEEGLATVLGLRSAGFEVSVILAGRSVQGSASAGELEVLGVNAARVSAEADIRALGL